MAEKRRVHTEVEDHPRFRRGFVWSSHSSQSMSPSAQYTETAPPLPSPPPSLLEDPLLHETLKRLGSAVRVETPFDVDAFEKLLVDHPNQPFVKSVMKGLREGFWPFDEGEWEMQERSYKGNFAKEEVDLEAIRAFRDKEVKEGRWSSSVPVEQDSLPPGMKLSPLFVVWQKGKGRVITDHSASGINDGIPRDEAKVLYDDMRAFGRALREAKESSREPLVTFKSDVASAFLNLPAHPLFQLRQAVSIDGLIHIVRRLVFGNRASPRCWCAVSGLLCWIAIRKFGIESLHVYMDDFFGIDVEGRLEHYRGRDRPSQQVKLLRFWDAIRCPWEEKKQEYGRCLQIIGFYVDINRGAITLSPQALSELTVAIDEFMASPGRKAQLRKWQRLAGHINWALNVLPWGRPGLCELYRKMSGKSQPMAAVPLNREVMEELDWLRLALRTSLGVSFVTDGCWEDDSADLVMWTDASLTKGMGFVHDHSGFYYPLQPCPPEIAIDIFFLELVAILSAISYASTRDQPPRRLLIFTDSLDSVGVLRSLGARQPIHNGVVRAIAGIAMESGIDIRVRHIAGGNNVRADMLSRLLIDEYQRSYPFDRVHRFSPPRELLPARWRGCF